MKVTLVSSGTVNKMAIALFLKLWQEERLDLSFVVCKSDYLAGALRMLLRNGLKDTGARLGSKLGLRLLAKVAVKDDNWFLQQIIDSMEGNRVVSLMQLKRRYGCPLYRVKALNDPQTVRLLREKVRPDVLINLSGQIVRKEIIAVPRIGVLNYHMGILPKYRGMNALEWSLINNDELGITIHFVDEGIDSGDIVKIARFARRDGESVNELRARANSLALDAYLDVLVGLMDGTVERTKQRKEDGRQYFCMHERLRGVIERRSGNGAQEAPGKPAESIYDVFRSAGVAG